MENVILVGTFGLVVVGGVCLQCCWYLWRTASAVRDIEMDLNRRGSRRERSIAEQREKETAEILDVGISLAGGSDTVASAIGQETKLVVIHSVTLLTCFRYLFREVWKGNGTKEFREDFLYAAGVRVGENTYVISTLLPVEFSEQSAVGLRVEQTSNIKAFTLLDDLQLSLVAHCHSHPGGYGPQSTFPSATDRKFQARLEQVGCPAIGLIFARTPTGEGYVRFFGGENTRFQVEVQGSHVEKIEERVCRISVDDGNLPIKTIIATC